MATAVAAGAAPALTHAAELEFGLIGTKIEVTLSAGPALLLVVNRSSVITGVVRLGVTSRSISTPSLPGRNGPKTLRRRSKATRTGRMLRPPATRAVDSGPARVRTRRLTRHSGWQGHDCRPVGPGFADSDGAGGTGGVPVGTRKGSSDQCKSTQVGQALELSLMITPGPAQDWRRRRRRRPSSCPRRRNTARARS